MPSTSKPSNLRATKRDEATFSEVVRLIAASRERAFQAVNAELIDLYWQVGATISRKIKAAEWGDGVAYIARRRKSRTTGATIAAIASPHHSEVEQKPENYFGVSIPEKGLSSNWRTIPSSPACGTNLFVISLDNRRQCKLSGVKSFHDKFTRFGGNTT